MSAPRPRLLAAALALGALVAPGAARAQVEPDTLPVLRDTIVFGTPLGGDSASASGGEASSRPSRWAEPFAVRASGRVAARPPAREVVWLHPDSARKLAAAASDTSAEGEADSAATEPDGEVELDTASAAPPRWSTRVAARDTAASEARPTRRASSRDTASAEERPTTRRTTARRDTASAAEERPTRRAASRDAGEGEERPARSTAAAAAGGSRARTHTVARGETFYGIARRYGVTSAQLRALNPDLDWQNLEVGDVLRLPARARTPGQSSPATAPGNANREGSSPRPAQSAPRRRTHTVERGETLFGLARRYGVTVEAIRRANDMGEDEGLRIGRTVVIPAAPR